MAGGVVKRGREAGFTLIEIILVLILMGLLSALTSSHINQLQVENEVLERERLMMIARIVHARNEALFLNKKRDFQITQEGRAIQYTNLSPLIGDSYTNTSTLVISLQDVRVAPDNSNTQGTLTLSFNKDGTYSGPHTLTFISDNNESKFISITINDLGYVQ